MNTYTYMHKKKRPNKYIRPLLREVLALRLYVIVVRLHCKHTINTTNNLNCILYYKTYKCYTIDVRLVNSIISSI